MAEWEDVREDVEARDRMEWAAELLDRDCRRGAQSSCRLLATAKGGL